jgi:chromosome segregation ATPase
MEVIRPKEAELNSSAESAPDSRSSYEAEYKRLDGEWGELLSQVRTLLAVQGKTEEQIRNDQWRVEALIQRADHIHARQTYLHEELARAPLEGN